jgi:hypothetical protein
MQINPICAAFAIMFHELLTAPIGGSARVLLDLVYHSASPSLDVEWVRRDQAVEVVVGQAPVDAVIENGAAVASRSRLATAGPMRHERMVVLFAADRRPR